MGLAALLLARPDRALGYPWLDATNQDQVPQGTELAAPEAQDLQHQLQLANGLTAPPGGGWTIVPRIDWQEGLTDNALEQNAPRRADLVSYLSPGIGLAADLPRLQLTFDYAPTLTIYAQTGDLNALTEELNGVGRVTLAPDLAYLDVRALSGVHSLYGGLGGLGSLGNPAGAATTALTAIPNLAGNGEGLNRNNAVQTTSFSLSPYLLRRFGDWGTGKLGYSFAVTDSNALTGFAESPLPTGGANAQTLVSNEEIAHFASGDIMPFLQDSFDVDLQQTQGNTGTGLLAIDLTGQTATQNTSSTRALVSNQITYPINHSIAVFASGGHEDITYTGFDAQSVHDLTWSVGTSLTPDPDSALTVSYGHLNGFNSLTVNGHYQATARTLLTASYASMLGTQLEMVQNQLNLASAGASGGLVNAQTGGALFGTSNALGVQAGVFRTTTLTLGGQTTLDRDIIALAFLLATQTTSGNLTGATLQTKTATASWLHQLRPDVQTSAAISFAMQDQTGGGAPSLANPGNNTSVAASLAWRWQISDTLSASLRYAFVERQAAATALSLYENMLILGLSKHF